MENGKLPRIRGPLCGRNVTIRFQSARFPGFVGLSPAWRSSLSWWLRRHGPRARGGGLGGAAGRRPRARARVRPDDVGPRHPGSGPGPDGRARRRHGSLRPRLAERPCPRPCDPRDRAPLGGAASRTAARSSTSTRRSPSSTPASRTTTSRSSTSATPTPRPTTRPAPSGALSRLASATAAADSSPSASRGSTTCKRGCGTGARTTGRRRRRTGPRRPRGGSSATASTACAAPPSTRITPARAPGASTRRRPRGSTSRTSPSRAAARSTCTSTARARGEGLDDARPRRRHRRGARSR